MKVLADYHHHDLWESLELMCARLGWELYRPIGMEWFDAGYWNFERAWHGDAVAKQYLSHYGDDIDQPWHTIRLDKSHLRYHKMVTLEQARTTNFDIVIASVAHNHEGLHRFAKEVGAKFGIHIGNVRFTPNDMNEDRWDLADFGIVTTLLPTAPPKPHVVVHQEFDLGHFYAAPPILDGKFRISSFVNCFPENEQGYANFVDMAHRLPEYDWRVYGAYGQKSEDEFAAGNINICANVAVAMRASDIAWHAKHWSDGFGHVIHNWFAVGRPVFGYEEYYKKQLAGPLWVDGVTSINIATRDKETVANLIRELQLDPEKHARMSEAAAKRFREVVNFDEEEQMLRKLFERVL